MGTSRPQGNTHQLAQLYINYTTADFFPKNYCITPFDYQHQNINDDFIALISNLVKYDHIVFATPVYWYSMSAQMKILFDRFSDLLNVEKALGRKLRHKKCSVLATGFDQSLPNCFLQPFVLTASYLGMEYVDCFYSCCLDDFKNEEKKHTESLKGYLQLI